MFRGGGTRTSSEGILRPPTHGTHACEHTHHHSSRAHGEGCGCHVPRTALRGPPHLIPTPPGTAHTAPASCPSRPASTQQPRPCRAWGTRAEPEQKKQGCSCETGLDGSWGKTTGQVMRPPACSQCTFQMVPKALLPPPRPLRGVGGSFQSYSPFCPPGGPCPHPNIWGLDHFYPGSSRALGSQPRPRAPQPSTSGALGRDGEAYSPAPPHTCTQPCLGGCPAHPAPRVFGIKEARLLGGGFLAAGGKGCEGA